jgi:hypothetical protein
MTPRLAPLPESFVIISNAFIRLISN